MSESEDPASAADPDDPEAVDAAGAEAVDATEAGLQDLPDGSGCAEIWDYLSARRRQD